MEMLESNYRTWCAQNNISIEDGPSTINEDGEEEMQLDDEPQSTEDKESGVDDNEEGEEEQYEEEKEWEGIMDVDDADTPSFFHDELDQKAKTLNANNNKSGRARKKKGKVAELVREKVRRVLEDETELADKRARMCDEGDFLKLLWALNREGIHFS